MPIDSVRWASKTPANPRGREQDFVDFMQYELTNTIGIHDNLVAQWIRWLELYRAPVKQPARNIPYEGAANFMLPTIATDADQMYAKFMQTIHATENVWTTTALNERWVDAAKPLQDFLTWLDGSLLHMYDVNKRVVSEMVKLGTGIYKTGWTYEKRSVMTYNDQGKIVKADKITGKPFVDHVRLADFLFPPNAYALDPDAQGGAVWCAERLRVSVDRLKWLGTSGSPMLPNLDKDNLALILNWYERGVTAFDAAVQRNDYIKASSAAAVDFDNMTTHATTSDGGGVPNQNPKEVELWEVHCRFPSSTNDSQDDIVAWYHMPTRKLLRSVYNYYHHGKRPYEVVRYFPGDGFYGIGISEQTEVFQLMDSDLFNFTWDSALLANSRMIVAKAGSNIAAGEPYWPGKVWIVDGNVRNDFAAFPMADIYPSLPMLAESVQSRKERRNGMGDLQIGNMQSLPSRTPATTTMSLMQEGSRRPDLTLKDMRYSGLSMVGLRILQLCQQYMASPIDVGGKTLLQIAVSMLGQPEGSAAATKLVTPAENVEFGLGCSITATSGSKNTETAKQDYLALMQIAGQTSQQLIQFAQIAMQAQGTPLAAFAESAIGAQLELGKRLLEQYGITNIDRIIPDDNAQTNRSIPGASAQTPGGSAPQPNVGAGLPAGPQPGPGGQPPPPAFNPTVANLYGGANSGVRV